jgi:hypothetical protein
MRKWTFVVLLLVGATILGGTVFREPIALAAQSVDATIIGPLDGNGNVKVHEQGTAAVRLAEQEVSLTKVADNQQINSCQTDVYTVPAGERLIIDYMSAETGAATAAFGDLSAPSSSPPLALPLVFQEQGPGFFVASQQLHFAVDAGTLLRLNVTDVGSDTCGVNFALGGHLEPA